MEQSVSQLDDRPNSSKRGRRVIAWVVSALFLIAIAYCSYSRFSTQPRLPFVQLPELPLPKPVNRILAAATACDVVLAEMKSADVALIDIRTGTMLILPSGLSAEQWIISPDAKYIVGINRPQFNIFRVTSKITLMRTERIPNNHVRFFGISQLRHALIVGDGPKLLSLDLENRKSTWKVALSMEYNIAVYAESKSGTFSCALDDSSSSIAVINAGTGKVIRVTTGIGRNVFNPVFTKDDKYLLIQSDEGVHWIDLKSDRPTTWKGVFSGLFDSSRHYLAAWSGSSSPYFCQGKVTVYKGLDESPYWEFATQNTPVEELAFIPDTPVLLIRDRTRVYATNVETKKHIGEIAMQETMTPKATMTGNGSSLVVYDAQTVRILDLRPLFR